MYITLKGAFQVEEHFSGKIFGCFSELIIATETIYPFVKQEVADPFVDEEVTLIILSANNRSRYAPHH
jgi:hypothetical protein